MASLSIITTQTPVVAYHAAQWDGIRLGHWRAPAGEVLERTRPDHEINIPICGNFTSRKHTASGSCRPDLQTQETSVSSQPVSPSRCGGAEKWRVSPSP